MPACGQGKSTECMPSATSFADATHDAPKTPARRPPTAAAYWARPFVAPSGAAVESALPTCGINGVCARDPAEDPASGSDIAPGLSLQAPNALMKHIENR